MTSEAIVSTDKLIEQLVSGERFFSNEYNAHLAGGAVRDSLFGKPVSDYDLFINYNLSMAEEEMLVYPYITSKVVCVVRSGLGASKNGIKLIKTSKTSNEYYKDNDFLAYRSEDGRLNVILCRTDIDIQQKIRSFPVSLSQIGICLSKHGHGELVVGNGFKWSMKHRQALYHTNDEYVKKIMGKYWDWKWVQVAPYDMRMGGRHHFSTVLEEF